MADTERDITGAVLAVLFLVALIGSSIWILAPFLAVLVWATTIVVATWPLMISVQTWLWGRRGLAVAVMTIVLLCFLIIPLALAIGTIVSHVDEVAVWARSMKDLDLPSAPRWVREFPLIGDQATHLWERVATIEIQQAAATAAPYTGSAIRWLAARLGGVGVLLVEFLLTIVLAAAMYANGEQATARLARFGRRIAGAGGERAVHLAGQTIRGVALGVVGTALAQSVLAGVGLWIAGVPYVGVLTALMVFSGIAQIGVGPVLGCAVAWLYWSGDPLWGTFLLAWSIVAGTMDNVLRPILIKRGANLPLLLIFAGVVGGLIAFGLIGIFVGPVVLAVTDTLLGAWIDGGTETAERMGSGLPGAPARANESVDAQ